MATAEPGPHPTAAGALITPASNKRACDNCHRRKVKCEREDRNTKLCKNCIAADLVCTYDSVPQKKGPKGSRAKVITELRHRQQQAGFSSNDYRYQGRNLSPAWTRTPNLINEDIANTCVEYYFQHLYPTQPILDRRRVQAWILDMDNSVEAYCLITSLAALMMIQPNMPLLPGLMSTDTGQMSNTTHGISLLEEVIRVRKTCDYTDAPTVMSIITSFYLYACYYNLDRQNSAWFHLREATTHAQILDLHDEETYRQRLHDPIESSRLRRLYWLLFISERAYAIRKHRPLTLDATIQLPSTSDDPSEGHQLTGFLRLVNLYKPFDNTFYSLHNKVQAACLPSYLLSLHQHLAECLPAYLTGSTDVQAIDLKASQIWLKTMVWQLSISLGFINNIAREGEEPLGFNFPIEMGREAVAMSAVFAQLTLEVHGVGLIEKLFDVACTLVDVVSCDQNGTYAAHYEASYGSSRQHQTPRDFLVNFLEIMRTLRHGQNQYLPLLMNKIQQSLPSLYAQLNLPNPPPSHMPLLQVASNTYAESASSGPSSSAGTLASPIDTSASTSQTSITPHNPAQSPYEAHPSSASSANGTFNHSVIPVPLRPGPPVSAPALASTRLMNPPNSSGGASSILSQLSYDQDNDYKTNVAGTTLPSLQQYGAQQQHYSAQGQNAQQQQQSHAHHPHHLPQPNIGHGHGHQHQSQSGQSLPSPYGYAANSAGMGGYAEGIAVSGAGQGLYALHPTSAGGYGE